MIVELLVQKKVPNENKREKKCIVSPEIEVSILHNANLDLEVCVKNKAFILDFIEAKERRSKEVTRQIGGNAIIDSKLSE